MPAIKGNNRLAIIIAFSGWLVNFIAYYPGFLSSDTVDQYTQSLTGHYSDWHPIVMAIVWSVLNKIYQGPQLMLLLQLFLLWGGVYLLLTMVKRWWWYVLVSLMALAPFIQNFAALISKDAQMGLSWFFVVCVLLQAKVHGRQLTSVMAVITALLILYGCWLRFNALPGAIPVILLWAGCCFGNRGAGVKLGAIMIVTILAITGMWGINKIVQPERTYPENKLFLHDMAGVFVKEGANVFPASLYQNPDFDTAYIRSHYLPATFDNIWWNADGKTIMEYPTVAISNDMCRKWQQAIISYPSVYLSHRAEGYLYHIRIKKREEAEYFARFPWIHPNEHGLEFKRNFLSRILIQWVELQEEAPYMQPYFWLLVNLLLFAFVKKLRGKKESSIYKVLLWSSLLYMLPQFFIFQTDADFRYYYWNCLACSVAFLLLIGQRAVRQATVSS